MDVAAGRGFRCIKVAMSIDPDDAELLVSGGGSGPLPDANAVIAPQ